MATTSWTKGYGLSRGWGKISRLERRSSGRSLKASVECTAGDPASVHRPNGLRDHPGSRFSTANLIGCASSTSSADDAVDVMPPHP